LSRKSLSPISNTLLIFELIRIFKEIKPNCTLLFTIKPNIFGNIASFFAKNPSISIIEGLGHSVISSNIFRYFVLFLYQIAFKFTQKVVFLNKDDAKIFENLPFFDAPKSSIIHGAGVDTNYFSPTFSKVAYNSEIVFLFIGRFLTEKGINEFIESAKIVKNKYKETRFQLLGDVDSGNPSSISKETLSTWINEGYIEYLGASDDVRPFIQNSDVIVLPSYREGIPRSILEGMAMGKVIIATDTAGCRETVIDNYNGFIVPIKSIDTLVTAMEKYISLSDENKKTMRKNSRIKVVQEFDNQLIIPEYLKLIKPTIRNFTD
jgi:glycosyltransferase involved in cell wall biosynthesis